MTFVAKITKQRNRKKEKNQVILIRLVKVLYFDFRNKLDHFFLLIHDSKKKFVKKIIFEQLIVKRVILAWNMKHRYRPEALTVITYMDIIQYFFRLR